jgi:hypothetical protein
MLLGLQRTFLDLQELSDEALRRASNSFAVLDWAAELREPSRDEEPPGAQWMRNEGRRDFRRLARALATLSDELERLRAELPESPLRLRPP